MKSVITRSALILSLSLAVTPMALAGTYQGDWVSLQSLSIRENLIPANQSPLGETPEMAIGFGESYCQKYLDALKNSGVRVIAYRGTARDTNTGRLMYKGNCDAQTLP